MKIQRLILVILASLAFAAAGLSLGTYVYRAEKEQAAFYQEQEERRARNEFTFSVYCLPDTHPRFLFGIAILTGLTFLLVLISSHYWSAPFSLAALSMFAYWLFDTKRTLALAENVQIAGLDSILYGASYFDIVVFLAVLVISLLQLKLLVLEAIQLFKLPHDLP